MLRKTTFYLFVLFSSLSAIAQLKIRIEITELPAMFREESSFFIAGNFNGWNPADRNYQFQKNQPGTYFIDLNLKPGNYEFKITRGAWDKVETNREGRDIANRTLRVVADDTVYLSVPGWKDMFAALIQSRKSTAGHQVRIIDTAFFIPQLNRTRRLWIYLPESYNSSSKKYPVLYMHDGQNVFEDSSSFSGEWGVDEALDTLEKQIGETIVVAIDNGSVKRINEYCPYDFSFPGLPDGKGEGKQYTAFLTETLKPYIDEQYRTKKGRRHTFIAGSSMGGLISFYAVLRYPKVFGGAGVFSPAFQVSPEIFEDISRKGKKVNSKIYFYAGDDEGETMVPLTRKAFEGMRVISKSEMTIIIRGGGKHNEGRWRMEFPEFYEWLMK